MKCLLCRFATVEIDEIFQHYVDFHLIESTNHYLRTLFERDSNSCLKKTCDICKQVFYRDRKLKKHNFLNHIQLGHQRRQNRRINILRCDIFTTYSIILEQHLDQHDFFNSEQLVDDFLDVVENKFVPNKKVEV